MTRDSLHDYPILVMWSSGPQIRVILPSPALLCPLIYKVKRADNVSVKMFGVRAG